MGCAILCWIPDIIGILSITNAICSKILRLTDGQLIAKNLPFQQGGARAYPFLADTIFFVLVNNCVGFSLSPFYGTQKVIAYDYPMKCEVIIT